MDQALIEIDGAMGEGGGQVLRSSLALSIVTQTPFRILRIRANRSKPGLLRQHLTAVHAAAAICNAEVQGASMRSTELTFRPGPLEAGAYRFAVGTAGSANLVLQTVLPPLMLADDASELILEGGTHNPNSPPFHFLAECVAPQLRKMGVGIDLALERWGFYPAGGGRIRATILPADPLEALHLEERGPVRRIEVDAVVANLKPQIAQRELLAVSNALSLTRRYLNQKDVESDGPGNVLIARCHCDPVTAVFSAFGRRGVPADRIGQELADQVDAWRSLDVPVGEHLADQLLLPIALAGQGSFVTGPPSLHTTTNIDVIDQFLGRRFQVEPLEAGRTRISLT